MSMIRSGVSMTSTFSPAPPKGEHGALAVSPQAADQRDVDVDGSPRLKPRA
jgi:hypothetical protein